MSDLKIAIVGAGFAARIVHLPGYQGVGQPVAAICDLDQDVAKSIADRFSIENVYRDWREMLEKEQPDVVSVCLPNALHREITIGALEAGAHVLCEKPLAITVQQAHEMFDKAREKGKLLMAAQLYRHDAGPRALKRIVDTGVLGEIYHAESNAMRRLGIPTWGQFTKRSASAGGALFDIGVHALDQTIWLMGNPHATSVSAVVSKHFGTRPDIAKALGNTWDPAQFDVDDFGMAFVRFEGGADLILRASWAAHIEKNKFGNTILGTEGGITTEPPALYHTRNGVLATERYDNVRARDREAAQIFTFLRAVRGEGELPVKEEETLNVQRILHAAYQSAAEGREVSTED